MKTTKRMKRNNFFEAQPNPPAPFPEREGGALFFCLWKDRSPPRFGEGQGEGAKKSNYRFGICKNTLPQAACPKCGRVWPGLRIS